MSIEPLRAWLAARPRCRRALISLERPLTVSQIARLLHIERDATTYLLRSMRQQRLARCLNPRARNHRVYGLTRLGHRLQARLRAIQHLPPVTHGTADWRLLGWVSSRHRTAVLLTLDAPLRLCEIRRRARRHNPSLRMSTNNASDVLRAFLRAKLVERVFLPKCCFPHYQLTTRGRVLQRHLQETHRPPGGS